MRDLVKVLLVEDSSDIRRGTIRLLRRMFDTVDPWAAESVDSALAHLRDAILDKPFDLVICDWDLLGARKGGEVLEWIREHASQLERRFVFFSANDVAALQGVPYVEKPSDPSTLRAAIQAVCKPVLTDQESH